jgi:hypothetical protein
VLDYERIFREALVFSGDISGWDMRCVETIKPCFVSFAVNGGYSSSWVKALFRAT